MSEKLDYQKHATALKSSMDFALSGNMHDASSQLKVTVEPRNKVVPIPLLSIPIPFTERGANRVRPNNSNQSENNTGLQPVRVKIRIPLKDIKNDNDLHNLWTGLHKTAMVHTSNKTGEIIHDELAGRRSHNPFRWLGRLLSPLIPSFISRILPNWLVNAGRVKQYGTSYVAQLTDQPVINSGAVAQTANVAVGAGIAAATIAAIVFSGKQALSGGGSRTLGFIAAGGNTSNMLLYAVVSGQRSINTSEFCQGYVWGCAFNASLGAGLAMAGAAVGNTLSTRSAQYSGDWRSKQTSHEGSAFFATKGRINNQDERKPLPELRRELSELRRDLPEADNQPSIAPPGGL